VRLGITRSEYPGRRERRVDEVQAEPLWRRWQVLLHVANHGTDHRAQLLRLLNDLGVRTVAQDDIFYAYDHP
jgi:uncharacterized damage-inducible protein DinB